MEMRQVASAVPGAVLGRKAVGERESTESLDACSASDVRRRSNVGGLGYEMSGTLLNERSADSQPPSMHCVDRSHLRADSRRAKRSVEVPRKSWHCPRSVAPGCSASPRPRVLAG